MNGEIDDPDDALEDDSSDDLLDGDSADDLMTDTIVLTEVDDDTIGDTSIEMNIEKLVASLEATDSEDVHRRAEIRRRLEDLREQRAQELDSTFNFNLDDDG